MARVLSTPRSGRSLRSAGPGSRLPELGAARLYPRDDEWRATVSELMRRARLVVIRTGTTPGLQWEIEHAKRLVPPERLVFVSPPGRAPQLDVLNERKVLDALSRPVGPTPRHRAPHEACRRDRLGRSRVSPRTSYRSSLAFDGGR